ncbi:MAG: ABC transporter permease [Acidobacteria bacterium]|nr:MAG: ABC transporter permease [Acidobacteriota bacterium]PYS14338.1 MAG: ABC transporter permease [Acidobacteriota bacterium]
MSEIFFLALDSLRKNKLRSFLTVLGVVIGVATVIGMSSIISGLNTNISSQIQDLGSTLIFITRIPPTIGGRVPPEIFSRKKFTLEDGKAIADLPLVQAVSPVLRYINFNASARSFSVRYRDRTAKNTIFQGASPELAIVINLHVQSGRWMNESDQTHNASVVVLGHDTAETIFQTNVDAIGKEVEIEGQPFRVIGVLEERKNALTGGKNPDDNIAVMPLGTFRRLHPEFDDFMFAVKTVSQEDMPRAIEQIDALLRIRRGVPPNKDNDFVVSTQDTFTNLWNQISSGIFTVMLAISSIALVVGGVGVMNIMLVSVTERTREIGVRKAIGATQRNILTQFLFEAMVLTAVGGLLGIATGAMIAAIIRTLAPFLPAVVSAFWVAVGFCVSVGTGLVFGLYPAYRAAVLSPIEALRYE